MNSNPMALAKKSFELGDYKSAVMSCDEQLSGEPSDRKAMRLKASALAMQRMLEQAISVADKLLEVSGETAEPVDFFNRGRWLLDESKFASAISDFSSVIELCARHKDSYYLESALLYRAIAFALSAKRSEALLDLHKVGNECTGFARGRVYSKKSLLGEMS